MRLRPTCTCNHVLSMQSYPTCILSIPPPLGPMPHTWIELHLPKVEQHAMFRHRLSSMFAKIKRWGKCRRARPMSPRGSREGRGCAERQRAPHFDVKTFSRQDLVLARQPPAPSVMRVHEVSASTHTTVCMRATHMNPGATATHHAPTDGVDSPEPHYHPPWSLQWLARGSGAPCTRCACARGGVHARM